MKIIDPVHLIPGVTANSYLLVEPGGLTVIDTGLPYSERQTLKYIAGLGRSAAEIKRILVTHADLDHYGALAALQKASGACTCASRAEAEAMARGGSSRPVYQTVGRFQHFVINLMGSLLKATPFQVDKLLEEGQVLPVLGGLHVVGSPGHSPGHRSFFAPSAGILFCGDSMRSDGKKGLRGSRSRNNWDQSLAEASVARQAELGARIICPGHGPVVRETGEIFPISKI
jgi:glyoxylase-like metal-dependent hydrolase (beta-lactamase superfamily II)